MDSFYKNTASLSYVCFAFFPTLMLHSSFKISLTTKYGMAKSLSEIRDGQDIKVPMKTRDTSKDSAPKVASSADSSTSTTTAKIHAAKDSTEFARVPPKKNEGNNKRHAVFATWKESIQKLRKETMTLRSACSMLGKK